MDPDQYDEEVDEEEVVLRVTKAVDVHPMVVGLRSEMAR